MKTGVREQGLGTGEQGSGNRVEGDKIMDIKSYRDLEVWQKAMDLVMECYKATSEFPKSEVYGLCSQIQRAAVSIPANIAEGRGRQYTKEFLQYLSIAYGSLAELETYILLTERLNYIEKGRIEHIMSKTAELGRMMNGLQKSLRKKGSGNREQGLNPPPPIPAPRPLNSKGFSLVELLISMVIASIVGMAGYVIFSTSNWSYKVQEDVAEAQQNVRVGMERLAKDIRTAGFGLPDPPFSLSIGTSGALTAPITVTNSSTGPDTITILGIGYEAGTLSKGVATDCNDSGMGKICLDSVDSTNNFFSTDLTTFKTNRKYISLNGTTYIELSDTQTERASGKLTLSSPAALDRSYPDGTPVYIIQAVQYSVVTNDAGSSPPCTLSNPCLRSEDFTGLRGSGSQAFAENIEDIQFAYGIDSSPKDGKIDYSVTYNSAAFSNDPTDDSSIIAVRATVVAKTRNEDPRGAKVFLRPAAEDHLVAGAPDGYRRRTVTKIIKLRNARTGG